MLARTILSAKQLNVTEEEKQALLLVLSALERNEAPHLKGVSSEFDGNKKPGFFNMSVVIGKHECDTTACILGWARFLSNNNNLFYTAWERNQLGVLFGMTRKPIPLNQITPGQAAQALRNFLSTADPRWEEILS